MSLTTAFGFEERPEAGAKTEPVAESEFFRHFAELLRRESAGARRKAEKPAEGPFRERSAPMN